jgi:multidrug resistance efflux pump
MPLRIRKEVQDRLKTSLDGTSEAGPEPVSKPAQAAGGEAVTAGDTSADPSPRKTRTPRAKPQRKRKAATRKAAPKAKRASKKAKGTARARKSKVGTAVGFRDFSGEIGTIRTLFDLLILNSDEPERLMALKNLTERYLADDPSEEKLDQVRVILQRQAAIIRKQREDDGSSHLKTIEATPQKQTEQPQPDRLRRGEIASPAPAAGPAPAAAADAKSATPAQATASDTPPLPPAAPRRTILSWLRRAGGAGGGGTGGGGKSDEPAAVPFSRKLRTALMASVWIGVGGFTISYAGALAYVNWMRIEIDSAMVSGNIEPVNAPFDGSISTLLVKAGDRLTEGARYLLMEDPEVEKLVKMASVKVERAREDLKLRQVELESEKHKRDEYISISRNKMDKILSDIDSLEAQRKVAQERFDRLSDLFKKGIVIRPRVEEASDKLAELTTLLNKARINQKERETLFQSVMEGHYYDGNQVVGRLKEAEAAFARAGAEVDLALEELQVMQQRRQINRVNASHEARVLKVLRQEGAAVKRGDTMLVVERTDERVIHAFVRQEEISRISIGDEATVFIPALRARVTARVAQVDRNAAFLDDVDARYSWKIARDGGPKATDKDRTARVTLKFDAADKLAVDSKLEIGMPTVVSFRRRSVNTVFSGFSNLGT